MSRSSAQADPDKLAWLNQHYLKEMPRPLLLEALSPFLERAVGHPVEPSDGLADLLDLLRERAKTLEDMAEQTVFAVVQNLPYDEKAATKHLKPAARPLLEDLHTELADVDPWTPDGIEPVFEAVRARHDVGMGKLAQPVRVAITGRAASPGIYETLAVLPKSTALARIAEAIHFIKHGG